MVCKNDWGPMRIASHFFLYYVRARNSCKHGVLQVLISNMNALNVSKNGKKANFFKRCYKIKKSCYTQQTLFKIIGVPLPRHLNFN